MLRRILATLLTLSFAVTGYVFPFDIFYRSFAFYHHCICTRGRYSELMKAVQRATGVGWLDFKRQKFNCKNVKEEKIAMRLL
jgi:hypothetical protein